MMKLQQFENETFCYRGFLLLKQSNNTWLVRPERSPMILLPFRTRPCSLKEVKQILDNKIKYHRIVIDTKFTNLFHKRSSWYREKSLKSGYIYQLYAYLRSQEGLGEKLNENSTK